MEIKKLAVNASLLASTRFFEFFAGLIRIKLSSILLGVKGVGVVEQLTFFAQQSATFSLMSLSEGFVKQISEGKGKGDIHKLLCTTLKCYLSLISLLTCLVVVLLVIMATFLTPYIFGDLQYLNVYYAAVLCLPMLIINSIPFAILKAFKSIKEIAKARVFIVIINLSILIPLIFFWRLDGAVVYVIISYIITFGVNFYFAKKCYLNEYNISFDKIMSAKLSKDYIRELLVFSGFGVSVGLFAIVSEFVIRSAVVESLGVESIGLYSPVIMWASMLTGIVLPSFSTYLYPRFCELESSSEITSLINDGLRLGTFALIPFVFLAIPTKFLFISLFYSSEFIESAKFLPYHFFGLLFYVWWYVFSQSLTPTGRIKQHGIMLFCFYVLNMLIVMLLIDTLGLYAYTAKFLIGPVCIFCLYYVYCKYSMSFSFSYQNIVLMLYALFCTITIIFIDLFSPYPEINYCLSPLLVICTYFFLNKKEKSFLISRLSKIHKASC